MSISWCFQFGFSIGKDGYGNLTYTYTTGTIPLKRLKCFHGQCGSATLAVWTKLNQFTDNIILRTIKLKLRYKKIKFFFLIYFLYCVNQFTGSWFVGSVWLIFPSEDCFIFPDSLWWRWWLFCPIDDLSEDPRDQFSAPIAQAKDKQPILV